MGPKWLLWSHWLGWLSSFVPSRISIRNRLIGVSLCFHSEPLQLVMCKTPCPSPHPHPPSLLIKTLLVSPRYLLHLNKTTGGGLLLSRTIGPSGSGLSPPSLVRERRGKGKNQVKVVTAGTCLDAAARHLKGLFVYNCWLFPFWREFETLRFMLMMMHFVKKYLSQGPIGCTGWPQMPKIGGGGGREKNFSLNIFIVLQKCSMATTKTFLS